MATIPGNGSTPSNTSSSTLCATRVQVERLTSSIISSTGFGRPTDMIYFQGHATPGNYARAYLERRLDDRQLHNFRQELSAGGGLSSYPHPYLMPDFWQFPTVSMGLGPIMSIYQARFNRYLKARGLLKSE